MLDILKNGSTCCYTVLAQSKFSLQTERQDFTHPDKRVQKLQSLQDFSDKAKALEGDDEAFLALVITEFTGKDLQIATDAERPEETIMIPEVKEHMIACLDSDEDFSEGLQFEKEMLKEWQPIFDLIDSGKIDLNSLHDYDSQTQQNPMP